MCTVTLSYDKENKEAVRQLSLLLATGLFTQMPEEDEGLSPSYTEFVTFDQQETHLIEAAHNLTVAEIDELREKDTLTIEESQMLLLRMVEEEYQRQ